MDTRGVGVLHSVERLLADIYIPALSKSSNWGELSDKHGSGVRQGFMNQLENFVGKFKSYNQHLHCKGNRVSCLIKAEIKHIFSKLL